MRMHEGECTASAALVREKRARHARGRAWRACEPSLITSMSEPTYAVARMCRTHAPAGEGGERVA
jgi:hypothetical protein